TGRRAAPRQRAIAAPGAHPPGPRKGSSRRGSAPFPLCAPPPAAASGTREQIVRLRVDAQGSRTVSEGRRPRLAKEEILEFEGIVTEVLPDGNFRVRLDNDHQVLAYAAGKMRKHRIRTIVGDRVTVEMSPYD